MGLVRNEEVHWRTGVMRVSWSSRTVGVEVFWTYGWLDVVKSALNGRGMFLHQGRMIELDEGEWRVVLYQ